MGLNHKRGHKVSNSHESQREINAILHKIMTIKLAHKNGKVESVLVSALAQKCISI